MTTTGSAPQGAAGDVRPRIEQTKAPVTGITRAPLGTGSVTRADSTPAPAEPPPAAPPWPVAALAAWAVAVICEVMRGPRQRVRRLLWRRLLTALVGEALALVAAPLPSVPPSSGKPDRRKVGRVRRRVARSLRWRRLPADLVMLCEREGWARTLERCVAAWPEVSADSWLWASLLGMQGDRRRLDGPRAPRLLEGLARVWERERLRAPHELVDVVSRVAVVLRDVAEGANRVELDRDGRLLLLRSPTVLAELVPGGRLEVGRDVRGPTFPSVWALAVEGAALRFPTDAVVAGELGPVAAVALRAALSTGVVP